MSQETLQQIETLRAPMTILFSDIKDSTRYAERKGDVEYMAMINRHNAMLFPIIEAESGLVIKTIGDSILAKFEDPVGAVKAAAGMQRALADDRSRRDESEQIRVRIGLHHGMGLIKDNDVFGDVVNAASHVEHQAEADQILITDALLDAAKSAGFECAKMGRAQLKGKDEPIDLFAVAWSDSATEQLIEALQTRYERKIRELRSQYETLEDSFDNARKQWRAERRGLKTEIEELEHGIQQALQAARQEISESLYAELQFQLDQTTRLRDQLEQDFAAAKKDFEAERNRLKAQIAAMQASSLAWIERFNNPARVANAVREQVEARLAEAKQSWQFQWDAERKRLTAEIDRLRGSPASTAARKEAARRAVLQRLGKLPNPVASEKRATDREFDVEEAKSAWVDEREGLNSTIKQLQADLQRGQDALRTEIVEHVRAQFEHKLAESDRERKRLEDETQYLMRELDAERERLNQRIKILEDAAPASLESARKQAFAEASQQFNAKMEEANRVRSRIERRCQEAADQWEEDRRVLEKQIAALESELHESRGAVYKAQKQLNS